LGSTFEGQISVGGLKQKDERLGFRSLEDENFGYWVEYLERKELTNS